MEYRVLFIYRDIANHGMIFMVILLIQNVDCHVTLLTASFITQAILLLLRKLSLNFRCAKNRITYWSWFKIEEAAGCIFFPWVHKKYLEKEHSKKPVQDY